jgi:hypothetical protein
MLHLTPSLESLVITFCPDEDAEHSPLYQSDLSRYQLLQFDIFEGLARNPNLLPAYSLYTLSHGLRLLMTCMIKPLSREDR